MRGYGIAGGFEMRLLLAVCFAIAMNAIAHAQQTAVMKGTGSGSCARYAEAYRSAPDETDNFFLSWALGYMSGINSSKKEVFVDLNAKTLDEMKGYLRQYCDAHPLANYGDGGRDLLNTLRTVQPDKK